MKDIPTSPRIAQIKRSRRAWRIRLTILFIILSVSIIGSASYFSSSPKVTINKVVVKGNSIIDEADIESSVKENLLGKYFKLFDKSNFLVYPHNKIYNSILKEFPRIENLSVQLEGFNAIRIDLTERSGSFLYCGVDIPVDKNDIGENCYFVNNDGYIFDKAPYFSGNVYFKFYTKTENDLSDPLGTQMISSDSFHKMVRFMDGVKSLGFDPSYLVIASSNDIYTLYLDAKGGNPSPQIIFKKDNDLGTILDNLTTAMKQKEFANEINSKYDTLSYIDLRFNNKVLYKFQ